MREGLSNKGHFGITREVRKWTECQMKVNADVNFKFELTVI